MIEKVALGCTHHKYISSAAATAVVLGGIFIILASAKVLPHGVNVLSQLGAGGYAIGGSVIAIPFLVGATAALVARRSYERADDELVYPDPITPAFTPTPSAPPPDYLIEGAENPLEGRDNA